MSPSCNTSHSSGIAKKSILSIKSKSLEILDNKEEDTAKLDSHSKPPLKKYYRIIRNPQILKEDREQSLAIKEKRIKPSNLIMDLGPLSLMDSLFNSSGNQLMEKIKKFFNSSNDNKLNNEIL